jgi:hypothetical protein
MPDHLSSAISHWSSHQPVCIPRRAGRRGPARCIAIPVASLSLTVRSMIVASTSTFASPRRRQLRGTEFRDPTSAYAAASGPSASPPQVSLLRPPRPGRFLVREAVPDRRFSSSDVTQRSALWICAKSGLPDRPIRGHPRPDHRHPAVNDHCPCIPFTIFRWQNAISLCGRPMHTHPGPFPASKAAQRLYCQMLASQHTDSSQGPISGHTSRFNAPTHSRGGPATVKGDGQSNRQESPRCPGAWECNGAFVFDWPRGLETCPNGTSKRPKSRPSQYKDPAHGSKLTRLCDAVLNISLFCLLLAARPHSNRAHCNCPSQTLEKFRHKALSSKTQNLWHMMAPIY